MKNRVPSFMASKEIECPRCGRIERANVDPEKVVMCSLCLMKLALGKDAEANREKHVKPLRSRSTRTQKNCERCGQSFRGRSNRQRFCEKCQRGVRNEYQRKLMSERRRKESLVRI